MAEVQKLEEKLPYKIYQVSEGHFLVYLTREIEDDGCYGDLINLLLGANPDDKITFVMNNIGGDLQNGTAIVNAIDLSLGTVDVMVMAPLYSMAAIIAATIMTRNPDPDVYMGVGTFLMFHMPSVMTEGCITKTQAGLAADRTAYKDIIQEYCRPVISTMDIARMEAGSDVYIYRNSIVTRVKKLCKSQSNTD